MADFSLADALGDDSSSQAKKIGNTNPTIPASNPAPSNPGWPGSAPGAPTQPSAPGGFPGGTSGPGAPGQFPFPSGPGAPGQYPGPPTAPGGFPPGHGVPGHFPPAPGAPGQFPSSPGAPPSGPYPNMPYQPSGGNGMYGPGGPGGFLQMVPYDVPLHAGILPRLLITIDAEPVPGADFHIDFIKGSDVVFHLNPRFHEQTIVRNSNLAGCWGPEEREGGFPFVPGQRFELKILVEEDNFKVAVDDVHLLEYEHRVGGFEEVTLVRIVGDVALYSAAPSMI
uniref:Galectin n=1 Tax=Cynoglossus semilaevis TaxID=244447 RepID=A0A3P8VDN7_CYNSE